VQRSKLALVFLKYNPNGPTKQFFSSLFILEFKKKKKKKIPHQLILDHSLLSFYTRLFRLYIKMIVYIKCCVFVLVLNLDFCLVMEEY
jgi:hypothetical protein